MWFGSVRRHTKRLWEGEKVKSKGGWTVSLVDRFVDLSDFNSRGELRELLYEIEDAMIVLRGYRRGAKEKLSKMEKGDNDDGKRERGKGKTMRKRNIRSATKFFISV